MGMGIRGVSRGRGGGNGAGGIRERRTRDENGASRGVGPRTRGGDVRDPGSKDWGWEWVGMGIGEGPGLGKGCGCGGPVIGVGGMSRDQGWACGGSRE